MPHDKNGKLLGVGDIVNLSCKVDRVDLGDEYCNLGIESVEPMYPGDSKTYVTVNSKQVTKED